jgi:tRNA threonylcarbamoyladenosine biosynthesis protein TsaB
MKILAVDTATSYQSVAILDDTTVLAQVNRDAEGSHAKFLTLSIDGALRAAGLALGDLDGLVVSIGPGSFTGLRVGLATLLGFRTVLGKPLVAIPTLEAMAWNLRSIQGQVCPILKSRKNEVYWARYEWTPGQILHRLVLERVGSLDQVAASIQDSVMVLGDGWQAYGAEIRALLGPRAGLVREASPDAMCASAVSLGLAARERFAQKEFAGSGIAPLYVQRTEAEIKFEESGGISPVERRKQRVARRTHPRYAQSGPKRDRGGSGEGKP